MPFWLRDLFSFSWTPATPADILGACVLLKGKEKVIIGEIWMCIVQLQYSSG